MKPDFIKLLGLKPRLAKYENVPTLDWVIHQEELERALEEKCKVVYGASDKEAWWSYNREQGDTHSAFIFGETEIVREPCKHEPIDEQTGITVFKQQTIEKLPIGPVLYKPVCKHCGSKLKPVAWEVEG